MGDKKEDKQKSTDIAKNQGEDALKASPDDFSQAGNNSAPPPPAKPDGNPVGLSSPEDYKAKRRAEVESDPFTVALRALFAKLDGAPKVGWEQEYYAVKAEFRKVIGDSTPQPRTAGDEHPDYRKSGAADDRLAGEWNEGT